MVNEMAKFRLLSLTFMLKVPDKYKNTDQISLKSTTVNRIAFSNNQKFYGNAPNYWWVTLITLLDKKHLTS